MFMDLIHCLAHGKSRPTIHMLHCMCHAVDPRSCFARTHWKEWSSKDSDVQEVQHRCQNVIVHLSLRYKLVIVFTPWWDHYYESRKLCLGGSREVEHYTLTCKPTSLWRSNWTLTRIGHLNMTESWYGILDDSSLTPAFITGQQQFDYPRSNESHLYLTSTTNAKWTASTKRQLERFVVHHLFGRHKMVHCGDDLQSYEYQTSQWHDVSGSK